MLTSSKIRRGIFVATFTCLALQFLEQSGLGSSRPSSKCPESVEQLLEAAEFSQDTVTRERLIRKGLQLCRENPRAHYLLGLHYQTLHMRGHAIAKYQTALKLLPLGGNIFRQIAKLNPTNPKDGLWKILSPIMYSNDKVQPNLRKRDQRIWLQDYRLLSFESRIVLAEALTNRGIEMMKNNKPEGVELVVRALRVVPSYEPARKKLIERALILGRYNIKGERYNKAINVYKEALIHAPNNPRLHLRIAEAYGNLRGHQRNALTHYRKADRLFAAGKTTLDGEEQALFQRRIQSGLNQFDEARQSFRDNRSVEARAIGLNYIERADYNKGVLALREAILWTPGDAMLHFQLASGLKQLADPKSLAEALQHFERALSLFKVSPLFKLTNEAITYQKHTRLEIDHLKGTVGSLSYFLLKTWIGIRKRILELSISIVLFAAFTFYLLRSGLSSKASAMR